MAGLPIGLIVFDSTGTIRFEHQAGNGSVSIDSTVSDSVFDLVDHDARQEIKKLLSGSLDSGIAIPDPHIEFTGRDGSEMTAELSVVPAGQLGDGARFLMSIRMAEHPTQQRTNPSPLVERIVEAMTDALWLGSPDLTRLEFVNSAFEGIWGRTAEELYSIPQALFDGVHPDDRDRVLAILGQHPRDEWSTEFRVVRPDGGERRVEAKGFAAVGRAGGEWRAGICRDISARVDAEARLKQSEYFANVNRLVGTITWEIDPESLLVGWSDELAALLEVPLEKTALPGVETDDYIHPEDRALVISARNESSTTGKPVDIQFRMMTETGRLIYVHTVGIPEWADGRLVGRWGYIQGITQQVENRAALAHSERLLAETGRTARIGGWVLDTETMAGSWTDTLYDILDLPRGERPTFEAGMKLCHPDDQPRLNTAFQRALDSGEPFDLEVRGITARGRAVHGRVIGQPVIVDGKTIRLWGSAQDITERKESEEALRSALAEKDALLGYLEVAQRMGKIGTWDFDLVANESIWTDEEYRLFGVSKDTELSYDVFMGCVHPDDRELVDTAFRAALEDQAPYVIEHRLLVDGEVIWIRQEAKIEFNPEGNAVRAIGFSQDITEQVEGKAALVKSEALLTETGRMALIGGWELDAETLEISWTDVMFGIFDLPHGEVPEFDELLDLCQPQDRPTISAAFQGGLERGEPWDLDLRVVTARGRLILARVIGRAEIVNGRTVKLRGSIQDITEQAELQAALAESESRYKTILDTVPDSIILVDQFGTVTEWNQSAATMFGYSADDALGRPLTDLIIPERHRAAHLEGVEEFEASGDGPILGTTVEIEALRSDGSEFPVELAVQRMLSGGKQFAVGIIHDVTERVEHTRDLQEAFVETIEAMTQTIATRDPYTADHQRKVSDLAAAIAEELELPIETVRGIRFGAMIHDIGKISVPAEILNRPGRLSEIEFELIKSHAAIGTTIIAGVDFPWPIVEIVGQHHERIDGSGYPEGLRDSEISQEARIVAVADVVEAMSAHRPYRASLGVDAALAEIAENRDTLYDSEAVDACLRLFGEDRFSFEV